MNSENDTSDLAQVIDVAGAYPDPELDPVETEGRSILSSFSAEWSEHLLDQLSDHELINGAPTVDGLRRICEKCFGEIIESKSEIIETPTRQNNRCTLKHSLTIYKYSTSRNIKVEGCVDVLYEKTPHPFKDHLVATADTRAEGKALRRALKIRVITAEELQNEEYDESASSDEAINDQQILAINQLCKRIGVSVVALAKSRNEKAKKINDISNLEARLLISKLSGLQRNPEEIEAGNLAGYDENWKDGF